jgi:hypothetical protein
MRVTRWVLIVSVVAAVAAALLPSTVVAASPGGLRLIQVRTSLLGSHAWYQQTYAGLPVLGGYYGRHVDRQGQVHLIQDGRRDVTGLGSLDPRVGPAQARNTVDRRTTERVGRARLAILPGNPAHLVWSLATTSPSADHRVLVDAHSGKVVAVLNLVKEATGSGRVFDPNPVVTLQDESLTDQNDADYAALQPAYKNVALTHLEGSGYLRGDFADIELKKNRAAFSSTETFSYGRTDDRFEQVMAYFDVTGTQSYIHGLGFTNVNNEPQGLLTDKYHGDNSFYIPSQDVISLGSGGVDDAEDAEVIWHEYGHAIQDDQVPGFGTNNSAGSIGEGFGDYWAFTMSQADSPDTATTPLACIADWDSISYTSTVPHCLRRVDTDKTMSDYNPKGNVHTNGEIWSRALYDINQALGRDTANRIILEAQFQFAPDTSFQSAAQATVSTAQVLYGASAAQVCLQAFQDRGIL